MSAGIIKVDFNSISTTLGKTAYFLNKYGEVAITKNGNKIEAHGSGGTESDAELAGTIMSMLLNRQEIEPFLLATVDENPQILSIATDMIQFTHRNSNAETMRFALMLANMDDEEIVHMVEGDDDV